MPHRIGLAKPLGGPCRYLLPSVQSPLSFLLLRACSATPSQLPSEPGCRPSRILTDTCRVILAGSETEESTDTHQSASDCLLASSEHVMPFQFSACAQCLGEVSHPIFRVFNPAYQLLIRPRHIPAAPSFQAHESSAAYG